MSVQVIMSLLDLHPTVIRGNASEIMAIGGAAGKTKGVDSTAEANDALEHGMQLARQLRCIVAISGATDLVSGCCTSRMCLSASNSLAMHRCVSWGV